MWLATRVLTSPPNLLWGKRHPGCAEGVTGRVYGRLLLRVVVSCVAGKSFVVQSWDVGRQSAHPQVMFSRQGWLPPWLPLVKPSDGSVCSLLSCHRSLSVGTLPSGLITVTTT